MKLVKVQVENFRSIENTGPFAIDDLTCLVGKNEAGKTAILQALHAIRPFNHAKTEFDVTQEYPRRYVTKYKERHPDNYARVVSTWWKLDDKSKAALAAEFGAGSISSDEVTVTKFYNYKELVWTLPINEKKAVQHLIAQAKLSEDERKPLQDAVTLKQAVDAISKIQEKSATNTALLTQLQTYAKSNFSSKGEALLGSLLPKFFYASHYDRMSGQVSVNQLAADRQQSKMKVEDEIFLDFLELAGTSLEELQGATRYEDLIAKCEAASNDITQQIFAYWTQNEALEVKLEFSEGRAQDAPPFNTGTVVRARVWNSLHRASVPFSERSAGFVWFFSFLVQFAAMRADAGNVIMLLDEPGLTLHGKAQADLLRYMEKELLPHHQVIFSTHSPFMVPADQLLSVRIVEDVIDRSKPGRPEVKGTKAREDVLVTDRDTLFPLQGALGYDITQSLFIGKNTLLVEGPSDILYLHALSGALKQRSRTGLNPQWILCPSGGIDKIRPFASLFGGNHLNLAVLADQSATDRKKIEDLRRSEILKTDSFYTAADFTGKLEADIEDLFEPELFVRILNDAFQLPPEQRLTAAKLSAAATTVRQVKQAEAAFKVMPDTIPMFDHFTPASWLIRNPQALDGNGPEVDKTLERAEKVFETFNALLSGAAVP